MSKNVALITGITGQDGSYLAEFLLEKGYEVHGIIRRSSVSTTERIDHLIAENAITLHDGDLSDSSSIIRVVNEVRPTEIYNLAAQSHVGVSLMQQNIQETWTRLAFFVSLRQYICLAWIRPAVFTRLLLLSCTERLRKFRRTKTHRSTHSAHMRLQSSMASG